jgi:DNA-binding CsgD family transcriptional regulator
MTFSLSQCGVALLLSLVGNPSRRPGQMAGICRAEVVPGRQPYSGQVLHGRDTERALLAAMLDAAREGRAASLVIRGGAGMGKTALLDDTAAVAGGTRLLRTAGLQSETALAFAALHRLLRPVLDLVTRLPTPQERALRVAFGEWEADRLDPFLVALGTLSLLTELADSGPVLCLVDDAQWLDTASADALLFATRRLLAEPVTMIFAARDDEQGYLAITDVPELQLEGLSPAAVRVLLSERAGDELADHVLADLQARTGGNPLALVELPTTLSPAQLAGTSLLPDEIPLSARVERVFLERCRRLSQPGQSLMLLAAADDSVRLAVLLQAGEQLAVPPQTLHEVEGAGLLVIDGGSVRVRHPLVRSAVYQAATSSERRSAHAALARALDSTEDRDRQAWHRAAAADGPDEAVAEDLAAAGARAEGRGGYAAASKAYQRAAELTARDDLRARRLFLAARNAFVSGRTERADTLVRAARAITDERALRADVDRLRCRIEVAGGSAVDAHQIFVRAARDIVREDPARALEMAAMAGVLRSHGVDSGAVLPPDVLAIDVPPDASVRVRCLKQLVTITALDAEQDWGGAVAALDVALAIGFDTEDRDVWANLANIALHLGDVEAHRSYLTAMLSAARADGAVMEVLYALNRLCLSQFAAGDWSAVRRSAEEAVSLARSLGLPALSVFSLAWLALLSALQGRADHDDLVDATTALVAGHRLGVMDGPVADLQRWARAVHAGYRGDATESFHHYEQMQVPVLSRLAAAPRIAAAVQAAQPHRAEAWTAELEQFAAATGSPWANAVALYGRALLADPEESAALFTEALHRHETAHRPYDTASTALAFGEHLRRSGRRVDARVHLKAALDTFRDLHAEPLVERAAQELRASGETARKRDPSTLVQLTPTELRIAQLTSQGLSNKEVAAQCWVSPRTVAFHLRNVFTKTGVTSRGELARLDLA